MKFITLISELRKQVQQYKEEGLSIGLVPTMGYLHEGHTRLIESARQENEIVVVSVFVNPLQFGPGEDYESYPRDSQRDVDVADKHGADIVFMPEVSELYPHPQNITITVDSSMSAVLCGRSRPGHFDGVATVVMKLLQIVQPHSVFFGMKDAQQVAIIQRMIDDFNLPVQLIGCPTVREPDGLAKSSRNVYLDDEERRQATVLIQALQVGHKRLQQSIGTVNELIETVREQIQASSLAEIDYIEVCTYPHLEPILPERQLRDVTTHVLLAVAVKIGKTRLIDNVIHEPTTGNGGDGTLCFVH